MTKEQKNKSKVKEVSITEYFKNTDLTFTPQLLKVIPEKKAFLRGKTLFVFGNKKFKQSLKLLEEVF